MEVEKLLSDQYFIIGGKTFSTTEKLLNPWPGQLEILPILNCSCFYSRFMALLIVRSWPRHLQRCSNMLRVLLLKLKDGGFLIILFFVDRWPLVVMM
jgi:hypothetical protein